MGRRDETSVRGEEGGGKADHESKPGGGGGGAWREDSELTKCVQALVSFSSEERVYATKETI